MKPDTSRSPFLVALLTGAALLAPPIRAGDPAGEGPVAPAFPAGIGEKGFIQKDVSRGFPEWLERVEVAKKGGVVHHALANDLRSLLWIVNQNTITLHVWTSRVPDLLRPDICVFDLDPADNESPDVLRRAALQLRDLLRERGHASWIKTSGSKGFHVVVRLKARDTFRESSRLSSDVANELVRRYPALLTLEFSKADRRGRILVDIGRNRAGATFVAAYSVRPRPGAPVSAPCTWAEIERGNVGPQTFTLRSMPARLAKVGDLWMVNQAVSLGLQAAPIEAEALIYADQIAIEERHGPHVVEGTALDGHGTATTLP